MAKEEKGGDRVRQSTTVRALMVVGLAVTAASLLADFLVDQHGEFGFDGWTGFHAVFGFASGLAIIGVSKALNVLLKRPASYYEKQR
jgi:uncharacterized membrane protein